MVVDKISLLVWLKYFSIFVLIIFVLYLFIKKRRKYILRKRVLADGTDDYRGTAKNIANSISKSRILYKELIVKVHPDKFFDEKKEIATFLSAKITKAKRNYDELIVIEKEVVAFLNEVNS